MAGSYSREKLVCRPSGLFDSPSADALGLRLSPSEATTEGVRATRGVSKEIFALRGINLGSNGLL